MMRVLIVGGSGQVGSALLEQHAKDSVLGTYYSTSFENLKFLDIGNLQYVKSIIAEWLPDLVYVPAAQASVDRCQTDSKNSYRTNVVGIKNIIDAMHLSVPDAKLIYFSTDYVFDGIEGLYVNSDAPKPICEYGRQKLQAEHIVLNNWSNSLIIRTNVVFGPEKQKKNFVYQVIKELGKGKRIKGVVNEWGTPTYCPDLVDCVIRLAKSVATGIKHVAGIEPTNRYKFALEVARAFSLDETLIDPVTSAELQRPSPRPLNAGLRNSSSEFAPRSYLEGLEAMKESLDAK
jgi:dTDP-4-dehydrorhamnose reductase